MGTRQRDGRLLTLLVVIVCCSCAGLQNPQKILAELGPDETLPLFWHVEGHAGANLYLLGSIHVGPRAGWEYPGAVEQAFDNAHALVVEFNPEEISESGLEQMIRRYGQLPPGRSLRNELSAETWDLVKTRLRSSAVGIAAASRMRPCASLAVLHSIAPPLPTVTMSTSAPAKHSINATSSDGKQTQCAETHGSPQARRRS